MKKCTIKDCLLHKTSIEVPYSGNKNAKIIFMGESPGNQEEKLLTPFIGKSGQFIRKIIREIGLNWEDFLTFNSARCQINKKELSNKQIASILKSCRPKVEFVVNKVAPKLIVVLGDLALKQTIKKSGINKNRNRWIWSKEFNCWVFGTYHPSYICNYNMAFKPRFINDLKMIKEFIDNNYKPPEVKESTSYLDIDECPKMFITEIKKWEQTKATVGIDTETQGLDVNDPNFVFISYSVSGDRDSAFNVRLFEEGTEKDHDFTIHQNRLVGNKKQLTAIHVKKCQRFDLKLKLLSYILKSTNIKKYMMTKFDIHVFHKYNMEVNNFLMDIQAGASILDENLYAMASLADLQEGFTDIKFNYKDEFNKTHNKGDMLNEYKVDPEGTKKYACADADVTRQVGLAIKEDLKKNPNQLRYFTRFTMPVEKNVLFDLENNGVCIDKIKVPIAAHEVKEMMEEFEKSTLKVIPKTIKEKHKAKGLKLTRGDLIRDTLFSEEGFKLTPPKMTKTGPSIDKVSRQKIRAFTKSKTIKNFIKNYEEYDKCRGMHSRYFKGFKEYIKQDDRIHASFTLTKARSGRSVSFSPNLQNTPKRSNLAGKVRQLFVPKDKYILIASDVAQSELRWMAHMAEDKEMMRVFRNNEDIHTNTAKALTTKRWEELTKDEVKNLRQRAKAFNFGLLYGMGPKKFINYSEMEYGLKLSEREAVRWITKFFNTYPNIKKYHKDTIKYCERHGYVESCLGRRRRLPEIHSRDKFLKGGAERQAINFRIQSPSSDAVLLAAKEIKLLGLNPEEIKLVLFIHDELIFEVKDTSKVGDYIKLIKHHIENPPLLKDFGVKLKIPLKADVKIGYNLNDLKEEKNHE